MGYSGYLNLDKRFIDTRGLTDAEIARLSSTFKGNTGVNDPNWMMPSDPMHKILKGRHPDYIMSRDEGGKARVPDDYIYVVLLAGRAPSMTELKIYRKIK